MHSIEVCGYKKRTRDVCSIHFLEGRKDSGFQLKPFILQGHWVPFNKTTKKKCVLKNETFYFLQYKIIVLQWLYSRILFIITNSARGYTYFSLENYISSFIQT